MEFSLNVVEVTNDVPNVIKLSGDVEALLELPLEKIGVKFTVGDRLKMVLQKERDQDLSKYKVYVWGIVYYVGDGITRISIGGLQLDIMKELPLKTGEKVYVGIL